MRHCAPPGSASCEHRWLPAAARATRSPKEQAGRYVKDEAIWVSVRLTLSGREPTSAIENHHDFSLPARSGFEKAAFWVGSRGARASPGGGCVDYLPVTSALSGQLSAVSQPYGPGAAPWPAPKLLFCHRAPTGPEKLPSHINSRVVDFHRSLWCFPRIDPAGSRPMTPTRVSTTWEEP